MMRQLFLDPYNVGELQRWLGSYAPDERLAQDHDKELVITVQDDGSLLLDGRDGFTAEVTTAGTFIAH
jgi:hypothetical protein